VEFKIPRIVESGDDFEWVKGLSIEKNREKIPG